MSATNLLENYQAYRTRRFLQNEAITGRWLPGWRTRTRRRALVIALAVEFAALIAIGAICLASMTIGPLLWLVACVLFLPTWTILQVVSSRQSDAPRDALDEREIAERDSARSIGLTITQTLAMLPAFVLIVASSLNETNPGFGYACGLWIVTALLIGGCSPAMILAWNRPDPDPEDAGVAGAVR
ncbi:hypothetical protein IU443_11880 [Nocardia farcinica]|uniref:Uncharacterized protein n=1 Tax=Nocardia farcinica TaxID=37329 RepID=A0A449GFF8_NOCFR|nr:hypothetical protein [Nocardia farcinica]MBF6068615.1 hypothetical protein [Nocardia farcinica]MBF6229754.1 hypothetical protein [Nocardia farcinica]MBF6250343.1 hypothetical protein [Nocardia farcinica]MBF6262255.1 hypothetical protein [Nocardia farcinica]MBF6266472.1 hypothetical protein [Nocardia farcinica]